MLDAGWRAPSDRGSREGIAHIVGVQEEEAAGDVQGDQVALAVPSQVVLVIFSQRRAQVTA